LGLVHDLGDTGGGSARYDTDLKPHANVVCRRCHCIEDIFDENLIGLRRKVAKASGFDIRGERLLYYGRCPKCAGLTKKRQGKSG